jgi:hypothetical protein
MGVVIVVIAGVIIAIALLVTVLTAPMITIVVLLVAVVPTAAMPFDGLMIAVVIAPAGLRSRLRVRIPDTAVMAATTCWNVKNLSGINIIGIGQTIGAGNFVRINPKFPANSIQGIAILNGIVEPTAAIAAPITRLRFALRGYS